MVCQFTASPPDKKPMADTAAAAAMHELPSLVFDATVLSTKPDIPAQFLWPEDEVPTPEAAADELTVPLIDLGAFLLSGDPAIACAVGDACESHGFFHVVNHGVDPVLLSEATRLADAFFSLPLPEKQRARRLPGECCGYASSFVGRFSSKLPWKETLSFRFSDSGDGSDVLDYFLDKLGPEFHNFGVVYQRYCEVMSELSLEIMELLAASLGVERGHFREFFEGNESIMRLNNYPTCRTPELTLGTGPHCDPTSLTILHQDHVGGLQVFAGGRWRSISPTPGAFVVNIGDTFMAMSNGRCRSCLHRAVVNSVEARRSMAFFLCPGAGRVVRPPPELVGGGERRVYPDFQWPALLEFTQRNYRADEKTLDAFANYVAESSSLRQ